MKSYVVGLGLLVAFLILLLSFVSWSAGFVVQGEEVGLGSFSILSPLVIGLLIMGAVVLLILVSAEN